MADLGVVIVSHQSAGDLKACVESLRARSGPVALRVVVADSGSADGVEAVASRLKVRWLPGPNRGFGASVNRAMADPSLEAVPWVLLVNPDVRMVDGSLSDLVGHCDRYPLAALVTVRTIDGRGRPVLNLGRPVSMREWAGLAFTSGASDWFQEPERYAAEGTAAWASGSFLLVRCEAFRELGGFDERFFLYSEEVDLATRARRAGWEVRYLPHATVAHLLDRRGPDPCRERLLAWGRIVYLAKWHRAPERALMRAFRAVYIARRIVHFARTGRPWADDWAELMGTLRFRADRYGPGG